MSPATAGQAMKRSHAVLNRSSLAMAATLSLREQCTEAPDGARVKPQSRAWWQPPFIAHMLNVYDRQLLRNLV
ncbi:hypothetical protein MESS2_30008 [Mesorhizobium metallidurans STM 2683]|uniref:Uncharacterized protein n=1 Tax=Mesorhizobium metallidurans STM 2683 TaxID=1297569 RepID=M5EPD6_9HYPH|nr:hypothetical protein MESS2_30008 [Mesorhizobium metallidurans STM 2683]